VSIDDRDWRREEVRQQRHSRNKIDSPPRNSMSVDQFLSSNRIRPAARPKARKNPLIFILLFLLIFTASAAFLLYQWFL